MILFKWHKLPSSKGRSDSIHGEATRYDSKSNSRMVGPGTERHSRLEANLSAMDIDEFF